MNRESLSFTIFRLILALAFFGFMVMLYWSSALIEEDLKVVQTDLLHIKNELLTIREDMGKITQSAPKETIEHSSRLKEGAKASSTPMISSSKNLLKPDPFYIDVLPHLLGPHFKPHGIRKEATIGKPDQLQPFSNWSQVASWYALCTMSLTTQEVGKYETFVPEMALSMELRHTQEGRPEYWIFLRQDVDWQPLNPNHFSEDVKLAPFFLRKHRVTAHDFKFFFDALMNPYVEESQAVSLRLYYSDIEEMRVVDDFTLVVRWKSIPVEGEDGKKSFKMKYLSKSLTGGLRPLPRFVYQYFADGSKIIADDSHPNTYRTNPIWAQNFAHHWANHVIVSCGSWIFDGLTDQEIRFRRNPDYYNPYAVLVEGYEIQFRNSPEAIWAEFKTGALDLVNLPPNLFIELNQYLLSSSYQKQSQQGLGVKRLDYLSRSYSYVGWNEARPFFNSVKVRQALTLAIDRSRIIRQNLNGMGEETTGPFFIYSPSYDSNLKPYPFDPEQARLLLAEEGWIDSNGDGIIDKLINGQRIDFRFTLTYYVKNPTTKAICEYIATALKEIGIACLPNGVDIADLSAVFDNKDFDAILLGWALESPPEDPKQIWYSSGAKEPGSSNAIGFANAEADRIINQLEYEFDYQKRIELYHRFDALIAEKAPYTFLYVPKVALIYRDYLQNVFIPADRQDLIPGANVGEPQPNIFWIRENP